MSMACIGAVPSAAGDACCDVCCETARDPCALTTALALDELETARACCRHVVAFLEVALGGVPAHPLLALQRFTLADLESACDDPAAALQAMEACAATLMLTAATHSALRQQALDNLDAMRRRPGRRMLRAGQ